MDKKVFYGIIFLKLSRFSLTVKLYLPVKRWLLSLSLILLICISLFAISKFVAPLSSIVSSSSKEEATHEINDQLLLLQKSDEARSYCAHNKFNESFCLLVNMSMHSGKKRFYVWDLAENKAIDSGLVSHGCGDNWWGVVNTVRDPPFSNKYESHCTSEGKYRVGKRDYSQWGINVKYFLHGLDSTNSNALGREIVLHSWEEVKENEIFPAGTAEGWGCPAISNEFMKRLDGRLKNSKRPVLLWIFNED